MSGETEIEVSVVSEEDLELEGSRSSMIQGELEKGAKNSCGIGNTFSYDVNKSSLRPVCNPQYTSFSISNILGRPESPPPDQTSAGERSDAERSSPKSHSNYSKPLGSQNNSGSRIFSPTTVRPRNHLDGRIECTADANSPLTTFPGGEGNNVMGHSAPTDFAMLSRYEIWAFFRARKFRIRGILSRDFTPAKVSRVISGPFNGIDVSEVFSFPLRGGVF